MGVLIDASILIDYERKRLDLERHLAQRQQEDFFLSVVTVSELLHGVHRAAQSEVRAKRSAFVEALLARFPLLPIDLAIARAHAQVWAELAIAGKIIGPNDLWLAATGLAHDLSVVTANVREFACVPGLAIEIWGEFADGQQTEAD
ncbi:MAG: type II toxin-antitoxin system VapC family toxin [Nitrospira sp. SB0677_bin_15]|nr:type II toxin-antitoxin system VapC family toxin [Nitrospira sp. SB0667_bin_9]MYD32145.1 type II toxin-antitoxin system VapC family toxin [Nitrospira sp. SB0661_bin_20]MYG40382.1 type II toxin-antitoxin system VapC family toxin [Nitrospira sp. SB0677_bin_15]MYH02051.1 type II toxin-antitoxin system VapC family toxin [Nitrospira sp. SB0675_bin_23]MYJ22946.1 type II toxin-antitoxin system VapC family toxin [Nitrospira sp. SB0673_bin_12]